MYGETFYGRHTAQPAEVKAKISNMSSFKSNQNIHKKKDGLHYVVSANKDSSVTL